MAKTARKHVASVRRVRMPSFTKTWTVEIKPIFDDMSLGCSVPSFGKNCDFHFDCASLNNVEGVDG